VTKRTGTAKESLIFRVVSGDAVGMYAHPLVALHYIQWISSDFHVICNEILIEYFSLAQQSNALHTIRANHPGPVDLQVSTAIEKFRSKAVRYGHWKDQNVVQ